MAIQLKICEEITHTFTIKLRGQTLTVTAKEFDEAQVEEILKVNEKNSTERQMMKLARTLCEEVIVDIQGLKDMDDNDVEYTSDVYDQICTSNFKFPSLVTHELMSKLNGDKGKK